MKPESLKVFTDLVKEHFRLRAEITALKAILVACEQTNEAPVDWQKTLEVARAQAGYQNILQECDPLFAQLQDAADLNDLSRLIESIPPTNFVN